MRNLHLILAAVAFTIAPASHASVGRAAAPGAWSDDADLTCISFIDTEQGWICGDRGVVLQTADGGAHWTPQETGVECRLRSIQFLDERHGWAVGGYYEPYGHRSRGVVLTTDDGGRTWRRETTALLPLLRQIRMQSVREGWAVGDADDLAPGGWFFTRDGGKTWSGAGGRAPAGILAGDLAGSAAGIGTDARGRVLRLEERIVQATPVLELGLRSARRVLLRGDSGWLVGDGGLVLRTADAGRTWGHPNQNLAEGPGAQCDWRAAARHGAQFWVVGNPGSVVLHTPDDGGTWELLPTGRTAPLADITFVDERRGYAVGALGTILATDDGGRTWRKQSSGELRTALWTCFADVVALPAEFTAQACAEEGYRTTVTWLGRRDAEPGVDDGLPAFDRTAAAAAALGVSAVEQAWAFPLRQDPLQPAAEIVLGVWGEGDPAEGLRRAEAYLVRELRTWRPEVVLTHAPSPRGDAPTNHLLHQLVLRAVERAADPTALPEQIAVLGLAPWQARKAFGYDARQTVGTVELRSSSVLACAAQSLDDFCEPFRALIHAERRAAPSNVACRLYFNRTASAAAERELFAGVSLPAGGDARRSALRDDGENRARMRRTAERVRNLQAVVMQRSGEVGEGLQEQIRGLTSGLGDAQAGDIVFHLAETFRTHGRWEAARETYEYLLTHHPQHAACDTALRRLIHYLTSGEADRRLRRTLDDLGPRSATGDVSGAAAPTVPSVNVAATDTLNQISGKAEPQTDSFDKLRITTAPSAPTITTAAAVPTPAARFLGKEPEPITAVAPSSTDMARGAVAQTTLVGVTGDTDRRRRALALGAYYAQRDPTAHAAPSVGFPLAAARRKLGQAAEAESFYDHFLRSQPEGAWQNVAGDETALAGSATSPKQRLLRAARAAEKPLLDGRLDDAVWRNAQPLELRSALADDEAWPAAAWIASDDEYLYLAVRCRRTSPAGPLPTGPRQRDADLAPHDRVDFCFDVDRDYATYYRLTVDCRGWTAESCWDDPTWDPKWFVAAGGDETAWIVEAAVPWNELAPKKPAVGEVWALGVQRLSPLAGLQSWTVPAAASVRPEGFGYLTFE